jgi:hypothetical protein
LRNEAGDSGYFPFLIIHRQPIHALFGLLGLFFVACDFRATLLFSNASTATIAFLVCHFDHLLSVLLDY